jgi:inhibitor of KinA sporulation pathway (predicted exonuclease)
MFFINEKSDIIVVDVETTGTNPACHAVVVIAVAVCDTLFNVRASKVFRLRPHEGALLDPKAFVVNGLSEQAVCGWPLPVDTLKELNGWLFANCKANPRFALWYCWGVGFDDKFMFKTYSRAGVTFYARYTWICMRGLATQLGFLSALIEDRDSCETKGVAGFLTALGEKFEGAEHDPLADVLNSIKVIRLSTARLLNLIQAQVKEEQAEIEEVPF